MTDDSPYDDAHARLPEQLPLWMLGIQDTGRREYWHLLLSTLLSSPRKPPTAVKLAILGHHFRRVAAAI